MNLTTIFILLFIHWVADFMLQTHWQAMNKSTNNKALFNHVATYSGVWFFVLFGYYVTSHLEQVIYFTLITFTIHYITDYYTSRLNTRLSKKKSLHDFFVSIGFDQLLHYAQIFLTYKLLFL